MRIICTPRTFFTLLTGVEVIKVIVKPTVEIRFDVGALYRLPFDVHSYSLPLGFNGKYFQCFGNFHTIKPCKWAESEYSPPVPVSLSAWWKNTCQVTWAVCEMHRFSGPSPEPLNQAGWVGGEGGYVNTSQFPLVIVIQANVKYNCILSWAFSTFQQFPKKIQSPHGQNAY